MSIVIWTMIFCQMLSWGWFTLKGGKVGDQQFLIFTVGMMLGQIAAGVDTYQKNAWAGFAIQVFFFIFTAVGGIRRLHQMQQSESTPVQGS